MNTSEGRIAKLSPEKRELLFRIQAELDNQKGATQLAKRTSPDGLYRLAPSQHRLWVVEQLDSAGAVYNISALYYLYGALDVEVMKRSIQLLVDRHSALRTCIVVVNGRPMQQVNEDTSIPVSVIDLSSERDAAHDPYEVMRKEMAARTRKRFNLGQAPLMRAHIFKLEDKRFAFMYTIHHIVSDGWSMRVFMRELGTIYQSLLERTPAQLPELPIRYADFAEWSCDEIEERSADQHLDYWTTHLAGLSNLELPSQRPRGLEQDFSAATIAWRLPYALSADVNRLAERAETTDFVVLLAALQLQLSRYTGQSDIAVGTTVAGRVRKELEGLMGFFVNTIVLRGNVGGDVSFSNFLSRIRKVVVNGLKHQGTPFERVVESLKPSRVRGRHPLYQVLISQHMPSENYSFSDIEVVRAPRERIASPVDMEFFLGDTEHGLAGEIVYNINLFDKEYIQRFSENFISLLSEITAKPDLPLSRYRALSQQEYQTQFLDWAGARTEHEDGARVHLLFESQAKRTPDAVAVCFGSERLSYKDLNDRANRVAWYLLGAGVRPGAAVGIGLERSLDMIVAVLAVLKSGCAYVPLDPSYPAERLRLMIDETGPDVLLTTESILTDLPGGTSNSICLDRDAPAISECSAENPSVEGSGDDLAYLLFTSGSTGRPKAVAMAHAALVNLLQWQVGDSVLGVGGRTLQYAPLSFDVSFQEIFSTLCSGGCLLLIEEALRWDFEALLQKICGEGVERLFLPVVALSELASATVHQGILPTDLREVMVSGEALRVTPEIRDLFRRLPGCALHNHYGPTETHLVSALALPEDVDSWPDLPPIGRPISNVSLYVLDRHRNAVPIGVPGELYIGGAALAEGYYRRSDLTRDRFVPDPFSKQPGARMYRTGDQVRWQVNGQLEYLGRFDDQIKLRGFRIEPGEIESVLRGHESIKESLVVCFEDDTGRKRLVAYVILRRETGATTSEIREFLKTKLPDYMIPSGYVVLGSFPRTPNGKVDTSALPRPIVDGDSVTHPRNAIEEIVAAAWADALGTDQVGLHDNFFDLGGHSLLAMGLIHKLNEVFEISLPVRTLFDFPTVAVLARVIEQERQASRALDKPPLEPISREFPLPLSLSQERIWRHDDTRYNVGRCYEIIGPLKVDALRGALLEVMRRHEALRSVYYSQADLPVQSPMETWELPFSTLDFTDRDHARETAEDAWREELQRPFDLSVGPPLRCGVIVLAEDRHLFYMVLHHIVQDGASSRLLFSELNRLYTANCLGVSCVLPEVEIQCADFAAYQRRILSPSGVIYGQLLNYWTTKLAGATPLKLPLRPPETPVDPSRCYHHVEHAEYVRSGLKKIGRQQNASLFMMMLAAFKVSLHCRTEQEDIVVGTYITSRIDAKLEFTMGDFVNLTALRTNVCGKMTFIDVLKRVRATVLDAELHKEMPLEVIEREMRKTGDTPPPITAIFMRGPSASGTFGLDDLKVLPITAAGSANGRRKVPGIMPWGCTVQFYIRNGTLSSSVRADGNLYDPSDAYEMLRRYDEILSRVTQYPSQTIASLSHIAAEDTWSG